MDEQNNVENLNEDLSNIIVLHDENGDEVQFEFLDLIEYDSEEYVVLLPLAEEDDSGEVVILKYNQQKIQKKNHMLVFQMMMY